MRRVPSIASWLEDSLILSPLIVMSYCCRYYVTQLYVFNPPCNPDKKCNVRIEEPNGSFCFHCGSIISRTNLNYAYLPLSAICVEQAHLIYATYVSYLFTVS